MKIKGLLLAITLMLGIVSMQAQDQMFDKLSNNNNISTVFISKALLSMAGNMDTGIANIKGLSSKLERMEIYSSENKSASTLMKTEVNKLVKDKTYEVLMSIKDQGDNITFYAKKDKNDKFKDLIMFTEDSDEATIMRFVGTFTMDDIKSVMGN